MKLHFYPFPVNNIMVLYSVTPCGLIDEQKYFWEPCRHFEGRERNRNKAGIFFKNVGTSVWRLSEKNLKIYIFCFFKEGNSWRKLVRTTRKEKRFDYLTAVRVSTFLSLILAVAPRCSGYVPKGREICCSRETSGIPQNVEPIFQMTRSFIQEVCYLQNR